MGLTVFRIDIVIVLGVSKMILFLFSNKVILSDFNKEILFNK